jgi:hypothetical protein
MTAPFQPPAQAIVDVVELRVMVRPRQAMNTVRQGMGAALQAFSDPATTTATSAIATGS